jgi:hypothetical protein
MSLEEVDGRLERVAVLDLDKRGAAGAKQFWKLNNDSRYQWLAVRFNRQLRVVWVTAFARQDSKRRPVRYRDIGNMKTARQDGAYFYTWLLPARAEGPLHAVTARGSDPEILSSISLYAAGLPSPR